MDKCKLGINIDHVATIRNARGGTHPDPKKAAQIAEKAGADSVTIHLREDRRHIMDQDVANIINSVTIPVNLEMAATNEMIEIAIQNMPKYVCIVPEKRQEKTTESGLDVISQKLYLQKQINKLQNNGILVSLFVDPNIAQIKTAKEIGAEYVEIHTGKYADSAPENQPQILQDIIEAAKYAKSIGLIVNAGHGLTLKNVSQIAAIYEVTELNIGHYIIGEAIFDGLDNVIKEFIKKIKSSRS